MVYLLLELFNYSQMRRIRGELLDSIESELITALSDLRAQVLFRYDGLLLATFTRDGYENPGTTLQAAAAAKEILQRSEADIEGFNVLIDEHREAPAEEIALALRGRLLTVGQDGQIWIGSEVTQKFEHLAATEQESGCVRFTGWKTERLDARGELEVFCTRSEQEVSLAALIKDMINSGNRPRLLTVHANPLNMAQITADHAIEQAAGGGAMVVRVTCRSSDSDPYLPFLRAIGHEFLEEADQYLGRCDLDGWNMLRALYPRIVKDPTGALVCDRYEQDAPRLFRLYLRALIRKTARLGLSFFLVCNDLSKFPAPSHPYLASLVADELGEPGALAVVISSDSRIPGPISAFVRTEYTIPSFSLPEVRERVARIVPDGSGHHHAVKRLYLTTKGFVLPMFHGVKSYRPEPAGTQAEPAVDLMDEIIAWIDRSLPGCIRLLHAMNLSNDILSPAEVIEFFHRAGWDVPVEITPGALTSLGLIQDPVTGGMWYPDLEERLSFRLAEDEEVVRSTLLEYMESMRAEGKLEPSVRPVLLLAACGTPARGLEALDDWITYRLDRRDTAAIESSMPFIDALLPYLSADERSRLDEILFTVHLRTALINAQSDRAEKLMSDPAAERYCSGAALLEKARFHAAWGECRPALSFAKKALIMYQDAENDAGEAAAAIELGLVMLLEEKLLDAREYFYIARHAAERAGERYAQVRSFACEALAEFIYGDYSRSLQASRSGYALSEQAGLRQYQLYLTLLIGRALFELGLYAEASDRFLSGTATAEGSALTASLPVFEAWHARTLLYRGDAAGCLEALDGTVPTRESLFFTVEALYELGRDRDAVEAADRALSIEIDERSFLPGEYIPWESGFASIENRVFRKRDTSCVLVRLIRALRSYMLGKDPETYQEAISELHSLTRAERLSEFDPYNPIYYFFYADILPRQRDLSIDDRLTVLSKAVKYMQERMSRIDDTLDKARYLTKNIWNTRLYAESKENNLV